THTRTPPRTIGSPNTRRTVSASRACSRISFASIVTSPPMSARILHRSTERRVRPESGDLQGDREAGGGHRQAGQQAERAPPTTPAPVEEYRAADEAAGQPAQVPADRDPGHGHREHQVDDQQGDHAAGAGADAGSPL